jgi:hypothetical protein
MWIIERSFNLMLQNVEHQVVFSKNLRAHTIGLHDQIVMGIQPVDEFPYRGDIFLVERIVADFYRDIHGF